jgi:hypothetical protein
MEKRNMESVTEPGSEEMGGIRRATGISSQSFATPLRELRTVIDPEVPEKAIRRKFRRPISFGFSKRQMLAKKAANVELFYAGKGFIPPI